MILFGIGVAWHWFCSCHGKCNCDPEGGAFKHSAGEYEALDSAITDRRKTLRNAWELFKFGRGKLTKLTKGFYSKGGKGVYRRFTHHIPVSGRGAIKCGLVRKAHAKICEFGNNVKVQVRGFRRVATDGFFGSLLASERPCCRIKCLCMGGGMSGAHEFAKCETSSFKKFKRIRVDPFTVVVPILSSRRALAHEGALLGSEAELGGKWRLKLKAMRFFFGSPMFFNFISCFTYT